MSEENVEDSVSTASNKRRMACCLASVTAALMLGLAACGQSGGGSVASSTTTSGARTEGTVVRIAARDLVLVPKAVTAPPGQVTLDYVNEGQLQHSLLVDGQEKRLALGVAKNGDTDEGTIDLGPGTYVLYCDIPGHRAAGMEANLTIR
jgi:plastocyanin